MATSVDYQAICAYEITTGATPAATSPAPTTATLKVRTHGDSLTADA